MRFGESHRLVEEALGWFVVGQKDLLTDVAERGQNSLEKFPPDPVAPIVRIHQNVLKVDDREAVTYGPRKANELATNPRSHNGEGRFDGAREQLGIPSVRRPAHRVVEFNELAFGRDVIGMILDVHETQSCRPTSPRAKRARVSPLRR